MKIQKCVHCYNAVLTWNKAGHDVVEFGTVYYIQSIYDIFPLLVVTQKQLGDAVLLWNQSFT